MKKFEYKIEYETGTTCVGAQKLKLLGGQGWELVAVTSDSRDWQTWYFKRELHEEI